MRYVVLDDDSLRCELLARTLLGQGFDVAYRGAHTTIAAVPESAEVLIVVGPVESAEAFLAREAAGAQDQGRAVVLVTPQGSFAELVSLIRGPVCGLVTFAQGAAALGALLRGLQQEVETRGLKTQSSDAARRALTMLRDGHASGLLRVQGRDTTGQVLLRRGKIVDAEVGALRGVDAAAALVVGLDTEVHVDWTSLEDESDGYEESVEEVTVDLEFSGGGVRLAPTAPGLALQALDGSALPEIPDDIIASTGPPHVLFVDDDEAIRRMLSTLLTRRGYRVSVAADGREGMAAAVRERPHLIVSDVMMPKLDGWGFLSAVRNDYRLRETPFALLSCHGEHLEYLLKLGAGADAYMPKGVRLEEIARQVRGLSRPRLELLARVHPGVALRGRFARLGPISLLGILAQRNATGRLTVEDSWATYTLDLSSGIVAHAHASFGSTELSDQEALRSLIGVQEGSWALEGGGEPEHWSLQRPALEVVEEVACRATEEDAAVRDRLISGTAGLVPDPERIAFYERVCPPALQPIIAEVRRGVAPREILASGNASPLVVDWLCKDMIAKGVVRFKEVL